MTPKELVRAGSGRRWLGLPPRVALGFGAALASLAVASLFSWRALAERTESGELLAHVSENQLAIEELESALLVSHTALDAYIGTRDPHHRQRFLEATARIDPAIVALERLGANEPEEREGLEVLVPEVAAARAEHAEALALADGGDFAAAAALRARGGGTGALERAKASVDALELLELRELNGRQAGYARSVRAANVVFGIAHLALLVLIVLAARLVRDEIRAREAQEAASERALAVQQRLMAVVSHDLRNPLTGILAAGWALTRADRPADPEQLARRIVSAGRRMERLIRDLLDWSRVRGGADVPISPCEADLLDVGRRIAEELAERQGSRIHLEHEGDTRAVFDPDRMEQILANLVGNALKYGPAAAPVRLRIAGNGVEVRAEVHDEGPGIPPETQAQLFQAFHRGEGRDGDEKGGLGLGLFIVRTLAEAQGARVELESGPGRGTTFVVRLPRDGARPAGRRA